MPFLSKHIASLAESQSLAMAQRVEQLRRQGIDVIGMTLGEPDFNTPEHIKQAAQQAIADNYSHYGPVKGLLSLREAISAHMPAYSADEIIVSVGAKQAICNAVLSLVDEGDEVVIPTPCWVSYSEMVKMAGGTNVFVRTSADTDYKLTAEQLQAAITDRTKLLILCSPNNPTGSVYTQDELTQLVVVLKQHPNIFVISDEVYSSLIYTPQSPISNLQSQITNNQSPYTHHTPNIAELSQRLIVVNGVSKAYAMTGYRIGWMACHNREIVKACATLQGQYLTCACMVAQKAAEAALTGSQDCVEQMRKTYEQRRALIMSLLDEIPEITYTVPQGAFYVFPDVSAYYGKRYGDKTIATSDDMAEYLLDQAHVACVAGSAYGEDRCIRLSYATGEKNIEEALKRIKEALTILK